MYSVMVFSFRIIGMLGNNGGKTTSHGTFVFVNI